MISHSKVSTKRVLLLIGVILIMILEASLQIHAAYLDGRPVSRATANQIHQGYLWSESGHRGIDFPNGLGTSVYAVADGYVVDMRENISNDSKIGEWGNYVLLRHNTLHYDRDAGQMACVSALQKQHIKNRKMT